MPAVPVQFEPPPADFHRIHHGEVHVWLANLEALRVWVGLHEFTLSPAELARAKRFWHLEDRYAFIARRAILRHLAGRYLDLAQQPTCLAFAVDAYGRPHFAAAEQQRLVSFNIARSRQMALFAFAAGDALGVDVEETGTDVDIPAISQRFFAAEEVAELQGLCGPGQRRAFFQMWTCKEAYLKACGTGLSRPLNTFAITLHKGSQLLRDDENPALDRWHVLCLPMTAAYTAALVTSKSVHVVSTWHFEPLTE